MSFNNQTLSIEISDWSKRGQGLVESAWGRVFGSSGTGLSALDSFKQNFKLCATGLKEILGPYTGTVKSNSFGQLWNLAKGAPLPPVIKLAAFGLATYFGVSSLCASANHLNTSWLVAKNKHSDAPLYGIAYELTAGALSATGGALLSMAALGPAFLGVAPGIGPAIATAQAIVPLALGCVATSWSMDQFREISHNKHPFISRMDWGISNNLINKATGASVFHPIYAALSHGVDKVAFPWIIRSPVDFDESQKLYQRGLREGAQADRQAEQFMDSLGFKRLGLIA